MGGQELREHGVKLSHLPDCPMPLLLLLGAQPGEQGLHAATLTHTGGTYQAGCCRTSLLSKEKMRAPGFSWP